MRHLPIALAFVSLAVAAPAAAESAEDGRINAVYAQLALARADGDVAGMSAAFAPKALLVDPREGPVISGAELSARLQPMTERLTSEGMKIDTAYRIERRSVIGDLVLDAGYMRQTLVRPDGEQQSRYARFLVTIQRDAAGKWRIVGDASIPAEQPAFDAVQRTEGLHYDE